MAILAVAVCLGSTGRAQDPFPVWQDLPDGNFEVVTALNSDGSTYALIVRDAQGQDFMCRLYRSQSFTNIQELRNCEPIITRETSDLQNERNLKLISNFLAENVPREICGIDASRLWGLARKRFGGNHFQEEFGRWDQNLTNRLIREAVEAINGLIVIEAQMREGRIWSHRQFIWSEFEGELDTITFMDEGQRVLLEGACR